MRIEGVGFAIPRFGEVHGLTLRAIPPDRVGRAYAVTLVVCGCMEGADLLHLAGMVREAADELEERGKIKIASTN